MKKEHFLDLVSNELRSLGVSEGEIAKQRRSISAYLTKMGIGEESKELDYEDPKLFADDIFEVLSSKAQSEEASGGSVPEELSRIENPGSETDEDMSVEAEEDDDISIYEPHGFAVSEDRADEAFSEDEYSDEDYIEEAGSTREFEIEEPVGEDEIAEAADDGDDDGYYDEEDYAKPVGNPVFFILLAIILSPVWIPIAALLFTMIPICFIALIAFIVLYIPLLIVLILGGSVAGIAEAIYAIVKIVQGQASVGLFELGLGFFIISAVIALSVVIYRAGVKYTPRAIKGYGTAVKKLMKKIRKLIRRLREVCSI